MERNIGAELKFVDVEDVKEMTHRKKKVPFAKYEKAVNSTDIVEWIKNEIAKSKSGAIRVRIADIAKELGPKFEKSSYTAIYTAMNYVLYKRDIIASLYVTYSKEKLLTLRMKTDKDITPAWIENFLQKEDSVEKTNEEMEIKRQIKIQQVKEDKFKEDKFKEKKLFKDELNKELDDKKMEIRKEKDDAIKQIREETKAKRDAIRKAKDDVLKKIEVKKESLPKDLEGKEGFLNDVYENRTYKVNILTFDFDKLGWKIKRSKSVNTDQQLLEIIKDGISKPDARCRIEISEIIEKVEDAKEDKREDVKDIEKVEDAKEDKREDVKDIEKVEDAKDSENEQPQEVKDKLDRLLLKEDDGQKAAIQYLIQRYKREYPYNKK